MGLSVTVRSSSIHCLAMTGVARASMAMTQSSPTTAPTLGSPCAVYAYTPSASSSRVASLSARSAVEANGLLVPPVSLDMPAPFRPSDMRPGHPKHEPTVSSTECGKSLAPRTPRHHDPAQSNSRRGKAAAHAGQSSWSVFGRRSRPACGRVQIPYRPVDPARLHPLVEVDWTAARLQFPGRRRGDRGPRADHPRRHLSRHPPHHRQHPRRVRRLAIDRGAARVLLQLRDVDLDIGRDHRSQAVLSYPTLQAVTELLRRGGWAIRDHPDIQRIEVHPERFHGVPTIRGTRIPARQVAVIAAEGSSGLRDLREGYDLHRADVEDAVRWYGAVTAYDRAA